MLLRVVISPQDIRRVTLQNFPLSVDDLCAVLRNTLGLKGDFILQFEDPEFGNELCNLTDIKDLPTERAKLKVLFTFSEPVLASTSAATSVGSQSSTNSTDWPDAFVIPHFSHDVEFKLRVANEAHAKDGTVIVLSKGVKSEILDRLANSISNITAYPIKDQYESVAKALVDKHPCLREPGSGKGWYCWVFSLRFKMGNYRQQMMAAGCPEVLINKRKRGEKNNGKPVKKSKKGEIHFMPEPADGQTADISENDRETMLLEVQKKDPDFQLLDASMISTFSQRRTEIIGDEPLISAVKDRWPALFSERQLSAEFSRIVTKDLLDSFLDGLDALVPSLIELYKGLASTSRLRPRGVLQCLQKEDTNQNKRTAALLGLSCYLSEDSSDTIRMCEVHGENLDDLMKGMQIGLLVGHEGILQDSFPLEIFNLAVVAEEKIILHDIRDVPTGFAMLMGAIYCLNLEYPRKMKYTFEFIQKVILNIKPDQCSSKIHGLRNKLLSMSL